jgi:hypothetical protein
MPWSPVSALTRHRAVTGRLPSHFRVTFVSRVGSRTLNAHRIKGHPYHTFGLSDVIKTQSLYNHGASFGGVDTR